MLQTEYRQISKWPMQTYKMVRQDPDFNDRLCDLLEQKGLWTPVGLRLSLKSNPEALQRRLQVLVRHDLVERVPPKRYRVTDSYDRVKALNIMQFYSRQAFRAEPEWSESVADWFAPERSKKAWTSKGASDIAYNIGEVLLSRYGEGQEIDTRAVCGHSENDRKIVLFESTVKRAIEALQKSKLIDEHMVMKRDLTLDQIMECIDTCKV